MTNTIYGSFDDAALAEKAAGALLDHGVRAEDLSLVQNEAYNNLPRTTFDDTRVTPSMTTDPYTGEAVATGRLTTDEVDADDAEPKNFEAAAKQGISTTTGADAGSAAVPGAAMGLGVGAAAALAALMLPGIGLVMGGGALALALGGMAGATAGGAAVGAITGYLKDQGVEEHVAMEYDKAISNGGAVLSVQVPSGDVDEPKARQLLDKYGANNVNSYAYASTKPYVA